MSLGTKKSGLGTNLGTKHKNPKALKGSVSVQNLNNTTRFKYRYEGKVYFLTIPRKANIHPLVLEQIRRAIETDLLLQEHDNTQDKYKQWLTQKGVDSPVFKDKAQSAELKTQPATPPSQPSREEPAQPAKPVATKSPLLNLSLYEQLMEWSKATNRTDDKPIYHYTFTMVESWMKKKKVVQHEKLPALLKEMNYAANTYNTRKFVLNLFCSWLVKKKVIEVNPFEDVASMKVSKIKDPKRKRLSDVEISSILKAIKEDTFLPANSRGYTHSHYHPIFMFFAFTGCRPAEGIGLQVKKVDFNRQVITIDSAFARTMKGSSHSCRKMKTTKTSEGRELPFHNNPQLKEMLVKQCKGKNPNDFVFPSPNGLCCYDRALNDTVLKTVLKGLNIPERILYAFRHSFASRCFEQGMDMKSVQGLTGHRDVQVLMNIYAEVIKEKVSLPSISL